MHYSITEKDINSLHFDKFKPIVELSNENDKTEFFDVCGKQHYRLLSYFSTLFDNSTIIDIGTHRGNSALALSYNTSNVIHTFDIVDNVANTSIKSQENIKFHIEDLFEESTQEKWKNTILDSPFIFLDVDPHNGHMETRFYNFLQKINYTGFVICDDIWYFKEMRDNFWYKIQYEQRYDLTDIGHWSGTGIFTLNREITFNKHDNSNWTLVTAYFNLTKCPDASVEITKRNDEYYLSHAVSTLALPYNLVIYCDQESLTKIQQLRPDYLKDKTRYIVCEFDDFRFKHNDEFLTSNFADYRNQIIENRKNKPYRFDNRNTASYYLFCMSRYIMMKDVITTNTFKSTHFSWINFCIERMGYMNVMKLDEALSIKRNKFSTCYIDYIPENLVKNTDEYFKWGRCGMCSGFFTGNAEYMYNVCTKIEQKFMEYVNSGYGHADEQLYSPVYFENPEMFEQYYGDYQQMITNYTYIYQSPEPPIYNFIKNSFNNQNFEKCYDACKFVWRSYCLNKCSINEDYLTKLYYYMMNCKKKLNIIE